MVKDVVEIHAHFKFCRLAESEEFAESQVHTPRPWSNQEVSLGHVRIVENVRTCGWQCKRGGIKELIAAHTCIRIADHTRTKTWTTEIADRVDKAAGNVTREYRIAVIAVPIRCKPSALLANMFQVTWKPPATASAH